jgi:tRNA (adenine37-N6)-methyltransferase
VITLNPIAFVDSCYKQKFGTPRQPGLVQEAYARILFRKEFQPELSLQGLEKWSHIWLIWLFHKNRNEGFRAKVHPPRLNGHSLGVFATRSPHRPNPIGLSLVSLQEVRASSREVIIRGADLIHGTPILDIKPYLPEIEALPNASLGWQPDLALSAPSPDLIISWTPSAQKALSLWEEQEPQYDVKTLVEKSLRLDPRPRVYKKVTAQGHLVRQEHAMRIGLADVHFRYIKEQEVEIFDVQI